MEWYHMTCIICWLFMSNCGNAIYNDDFKRISCFGPNGLFFPFSKGYLLDYLCERNNIGFGNMYACFGKRNTIRIIKK